MDIPQDIIDNVVAAIGNDKSLLKKCALVSSSFLHPSRKRLFSRIRLRNEQTCQEIYQLLTHNPVIQSFVRSITLMADTPNLKSLKASSYIEWNQWMNSTSLLAILRLPFCCLECFSIIVDHDMVLNPWTWNTFSGEMKDALLNIMRSSSLKTLSFMGITKVPTTIFLDIVHLTTLELYSLSPDDFDSENSSSLTQAASKGVPPVIDHCVWRDCRLKEEYACGPGVYEIHLICLFFADSGQGSLAH
jgi:hypothetical protein